MAGLKFVPLLADSGSVGRTQLTVGGGTQRRAAVSAAWLLAVLAAAAVTLGLGLASANSAQADAQVNTPKPVLTGDDALMPPVGASAPTTQATPLAHTATSGPGRYNVIVVAVNNNGASSPATAVNSPAQLAGINKLWVDASASRYSINYDARAFASVPYVGDVCTQGNPLNTMDTLYDANVRAAAAAAGYAGDKNLVLYVLPPNQNGCPVGLGWIGWSSSINGGYWPAAPGNPNPNNGPEITAHEMGHNFGLGHSGSMTCGGSTPLYPGAQQPTWPCAATAGADGNEYDDNGAMMGVSGTGIVPKRLTFNQLERLSLSSAANAAAVATGTFDLKPSGAKVTADSVLNALELSVPNTTAPIPPDPDLASPPKVLLELRQVPGLPVGVFLEQAFDDADPAFQAGDNASAWSYPGNQANQSQAAFGMTAGTTIRLADNRIVTIESITPGNARVSITAIGPPTITSITPADAAALIAFTPPAAVPGVTITNYQYSIDDGASWSTRSPGATTSPITVAGLTNGTTYRVRLRALTNLGEGQASSTVMVTPRTLPAAPTGLVGTGEDGRASIAFTPGFNGGAPITEYQYSLDGRTWWPVAKPTNPDGSPIPNYPNDTTSPVAVWGLSNNATYAIRLRAVNAAGPGPGSEAASVTPTVPAAAVFHPISPVRVVNTRGTMTDGALAGGSQRVFSVADGVDGTTGLPDPANLNVVPAGALAIAYNLTVPGGAAAGHLRVMPGDAPITAASNINFVAAQSIANGSVASIDASRQIRIFNGSSLAANALVDVVGYYLPTGQASPAADFSRFNAVTPVRVYDSTLDPAGNLLPFVVEPARTVDFSQAIPVAGGGEVVPAGASALAYNITVVRPGAPSGHLRVFPGDLEVAPNASAINWGAAGDVIANGLLVGLSPERTIKIANYSTEPVRVLVDVAGYYAASGTEFYAINPARAYDSRWPPPVEGVTLGPIGGGVDFMRRVSVADGYLTGGSNQVIGRIPDVVPRDASSVTFNLTVTSTLSGGHLRLFAPIEPGAKPPEASVLNWAFPGTTRANAHVVKVGSGADDRQLEVYNGSSNTVNGILDVTGYFR